MENNSIKQQTGLIYQSISGFYYVWSQGESYTTKPRGNFRHQKTKPLVGDYVVFEIDELNKDSESRIIEIQPRKNQLVRPSIANVDYAFIVMSLVEPDFSYNLLDYFLVSIEHQRIQSIIILSKYDLILAEKGLDEANNLIEAIRSIYQPIGYEVIVLDNTQAKIQSIIDGIKEGVCVVMGQSGVGKSTMLNHLLPEAQIETAEISDSLNRGRHTTREVTLYPLGKGFVADTPGFSAIDFDDIEKEELADCFPEMRAVSHLCKFRSCQHLNEPNCAVKAGVADGSISQSRYQNYEQIYAKIEQRKPIYNRKNS
ncbi:ribosome small subunit-dependent GTPase A [Fundicoccus culcitae]|uniref:Small ribosomal subunit biogenesis GTPase RsgA n=1 Tax=Fundicoccus culcitae TaxID=2969821 RepID=A0ABY5P5X7_9LACT|nr:ribosome small subunit-dependent GTPase A [Fundicoccus culcitae]UUX34084.1 ribosome small subunit-dependent GTPase A [Fundicoccus culcitae]